MYRLKKYLDTGKPMLAAWCSITDQHYLERICEHSFDAVVLDMQHDFLTKPLCNFGFQHLLPKAKRPWFVYPWAVGILLHA